MRWIGFVPLAIVLFLPEPSFSQEWIEYKNAEEGFSINFPGEPTVQTTTYVSESGETLPAAFTQPWRVRPDTPSPSSTTIRSRA